MLRLIVGFAQDGNREWTAELECGHRRHVRHAPPWEDRAWILNPESRRAHLGTPLECGLCDATSRQRFEDAKLQGLCDTGADEIARGPK